MASKLFFFLAFSFCAFNVSAQFTDSDNLTVDITNEVTAQEDWAFFTNDNQRQIYIDFEAFGGYASDLTIANEDGEIVLTENLMDLPKNSIYQLDLTTLEKGNYSLKIRTYQDVVNHDVLVK